MKLTMKNIGVIRDAEIELDGITVLAGLNGTGKSTASKALYGAIAPYVDLSMKVANERINSVHHIITFDLIAPLYEQRRLFDTSSVTKFASKLADKSRPIPERYEEWVDLFPAFLREADSVWAKAEVFPQFLEKLRNAVNRPDSEYVQYLASVLLQLVFDEQINTIDSPQSTEIAWTAGQEPRRITIAGNKVVEFTGKETVISRPIYLEPCHVLGGVNDFRKDVPYNSELYSLLKYPNSEQTFEEYKSRERIQDMISAVIHGKLIVSAFGEFVFKDDRFSEPISLRNVASGIKTFALLQRLTENGALRGNTILIIDEPESNQHPEWQLKLAETLVLLHKELGVRLFLNTHSTYFLRAIEVYADEYELSSRCHYYQTQPVEGTEKLFFVRNVDENTNLIYHDFYMPLEEL